MDENAKMYVGSEYPYQANQVIKKSFDAVIAGGSTYIFLPVSKFKVINCSKDHIIIEEKK